MYALLGRTDDIPPEPEHLAGYYDQLDTTAREFHERVASDQEHAGKALMQLAEVYIENHPIT
ncbi:MAG TPA: hypothetical protein VJR27_01785 [Candidatus Saccharimonadales bacterium]|nr:hypothetical protein [Candidatus Saccharimonadales bacterium]